MLKEKESVIDFRELRAQKARLLTTNEKLREKTGLSFTTITACLNGSERLNLDTLKTFAAGLNLQVKVTFEPMPKGEPNGASN